MSKRKKHKNKKCIPCEGLGMIDGKQCTKCRGLGYYKVMRNK